LTIDSQVSKEWLQKSGHVNFGNIQIHPSVPSATLSQALEENEQWSSEAWLYVRGDGECALYVEFKTRLSRGR